MKTEELNYHLPSELIAQRPLPVRSDSRLLVLNRFSGEIFDSQFHQLGEFLLPGDCLVLNDTKVVPARFFARRHTGARLEGLFLEQSSDGAWTVYLKGARKVGAGEEICIEGRLQGDFCTAVVIEKTDSGECKLELAADTDAHTVLDRIGLAPLPPYIKRRRDSELASEDLLDYQTVYAQKVGAVAAPTAGLHFTEPLIEKLKQAGVRFAFVTLHVGAGTFKPVTAEDLEDHRIHTEQYSIDADNAKAINQARTESRRIIPVGTTSTRVLETVASGSGIRAASGKTDLFIKPGYKFKITDAMITNFHLPESTLLALVAAFAGLENTMSAYKHAIEKRYRFYSYGDAMLIAGQH
jgi:S-adenosylmethionine:tRNA ribosyltransferase-isomerase